MSTDLLHTLFGDDYLSALNPALIAGGVPGCALTRLLREWDGRWEGR